MRVMSAENRLRQYFKWRLKAAEHVALAVAADAIDNLRVLEEEAVEINSLEVLAAESLSIDALGDFRKEAEAEVASISRYCKFVCELADSRGLDPAF